MMLSVREIMALLSLPGIGRQAVFKAATVRNESADVADCAENLARDGIVMRTKVGRKPITAEDLRKALEQADDCLYRSSQKGIRALGFWDKSFPPRLKKACNAAGKPDVWPECSQREALASFRDLHWVATQRLTRAP